MNSKASQVSPQWIQEFRTRMSVASQLPHDEHTIPLSIKLRIQGGCFHREHAPSAYKIIDEHLQNHSELKQNTLFFEHETGPEIVAYVTLMAESAGLVSSILDFLLVILKARILSGKKNESIGPGIDLIVRGFRTDDSYFQETLLKVDNPSELDVKKFQKLIEKAFKPLPKPNPQKK